MKNGFKFLSSPLFILKKLQAESIIAQARFLKGSVLDIGCGTKPYKDYLEASGYIGIDESGAVRPDLCGRCVPLPFKDYSFDSVICTELLEHLAQPELCLAEIKRVLKAGGYVYLTAPQTWCLHYEPYDFWRFTRYGLEHLLQKGGFKIVSIARIGGVFSLIGVRLVDFIWTGSVNLFSFLGKSRAERLATGLCLGLSLGFYFLGRLLDNLDRRDALGWAVLAQK